MRILGALSYQLSTEEPTGAGLRRIAAEAVAHAGAVFDDPSVSPEGQVHELRKSCKKMRALLHLVGTAGGEAEQRFRDASRLVSTIRDRHVRAEWLADDSSTPALLDETERDAIRNALALMDDGLATMSLPPVNEQGLECLQAGFRATLERCRESLRRAREQPTNHRYHRLRKWTKYHWYQLRLLRERVPDLEDRLSAMHHVGEDLGTAQDIAVLNAHWSERDEPAPDGLAGLERRRKKLQKRSLEACRHWFSQPVRIVPSNGKPSGPFRDGLD